MKWTEKIDEFISGSIAALRFQIESRCTILPDSAQNRLLPPPPLSQY